MNEMTLRRIEWLLERLLERAGDQKAVLDEEWQALMEKEAFDRSKGVILAEQDWKALNDQWHRSRE